MQILIKDNMEIASGEPIYKLVTSEDWSVVIPLEDQTAKELSETDSVKVRLDNENDTVWADFSILKKGKQYYGNYNGFVIAQWGSPVFIRYVTDGRQSEESCRQ